MRKPKNNNQNNFNGMINFNGQTQIAAGNIINNTSDIHPKEANYTPEPIWRSPLTLAVLSWISIAIAIAELFPISKIVNALRISSSSFNVQMYSTIFVVLTLLLFVFLDLRRIVKMQIRRPLLFNFAISGYGKRLTLEKVHIDKCPLCGGKMKYYNKPVEWNDVRYSNGNTKREVTRRVPALECTRNAKHWCEVDPAEDRV